MTMNIKILIPTNEVCNLSVEEIILPSVKGELGILEGHVPLITCLEAGLLRIKWNNAWTPFVLSEGVALIKNNVITVLAGDIEDFSNFDLQQATEKLKKAKEKLENVKNRIEQSRASMELKKAKARIQGFKYLAKDNKIKSN